jgi:hypothetical protein
MDIHYKAACKYHTKDSELYVFRVRNVEMMKVIAVILVNQYWVFTTGNYSFFNGSSSPFRALASYSVQ